MILEGPSNQTRGIMQAVVGGDQARCGEERRLFTTPNVFYQVRRTCQNQRQFDLHPARTNSAGLAMDILWPNGACKTTITTRKGVQLPPRRGSQPRYKSGGPLYRNVLLSFCCVKQRCHCMFIYSSALRGGIACRPASLYKVQTFGEQLSNAHEPTVTSFIQPQREPNQDA